MERFPGPWRRIDNLPLALLRKVLCPSPTKRYTLAQIMNHLWFKKQFKDSGKRLRVNLSRGSQLEPFLICAVWHKHFFRLNTP
jgi:serine/threonine-protein kinase Chk1